MATALRTRPLLRMTAAARGLVLVAMVAPVLWTRDAPALLVLPAIAAVWAAAQALQWRNPEATLDSPLPVVEAALVGGICGLSLDDSLAALPALVVGPFVGGLQRGVRGVALTLTAEVAALVAVSFSVDGGPGAAAGLGVLSWGLTGLGLGFMAAFVRSTLLQAPDPLEPYRYAQSLIRELIGLSEGFSSGLDVNTLGGSILSTVRDRLPTASLALHVPRGESLTPIVTSSADGLPVAGRTEDVAVEAWARGETVVSETAFAFPLGERAIVAGAVSSRLDVPGTALAEVVRRVQRELETSAVHFDTALLFSDFRDSATADERRRLAREMHDGVAQDIASLGYLVDALHARATPEQAKLVAQLRDRITAVVAEVRQSVLTLRTSVGENQSLGAAISSVARHLSETAAIPIHVTLDERTARLRPEVEAELFRISQEAINNAVKHSRCTGIEVHCQVHAPDALITVTDDGLGLQAARSDSQGLKIMRERAALIGAELTISTADGTAGTGTRVTIRLGTSLPAPDEVSQPAGALGPG